MGSLLGNYVHAKFSNYKEWGTYRSEEKWTVKEGAIPHKNYNGVEPFNKYVDLIRNKATLLTTIERKKLKDLETEYNNRRVKEVENLIRLKEDSPMDFYRLLEKVVESANLSKDIDAKQLARFIDIDLATKNLKLKEVFIKENIKISKGRGETRIRISTIDDRFVKVDNIMKQWKEASKIKQEVVEEIETLRTIWKKTKESKKHSAELANQLSIRYNFENEHPYKEYTKSIDAQLGNFLISKLQRCIALATCAISLDKLQAAFVEIIGPMLGTKAYELGVQEASKMVVESLGSKSTLSQLPDQDKSLVIKLDQQLMKNAYGKQNPNPKFQSIWAWEDAEGGNYYDFKVNYETQNKADFILEWEGKDYGVSAKNYDMSLTEYKKSTSPVNVHIHSGTSLYNLLYAMHVSNLGKLDISNHMLNVFGQRSSTGGILRDAAMEVLVAQLLYSGLSGDMLGKDPSTNATLLMIEDKAKKLPQGIPFVRFYNISYLVDSLLERQKLQNWDQYMYITPKLTTINLKAYKKVNDVDGLSKKELATAIRARLTTVLLNARAIKLSAGIKYAALDDLYRNQY